MSNKKDHLHQTAAEIWTLLKQGKLSEAEAKHCGDAVDFLWRSRKSPAGQAVSLSLTDSEASDLALKELTRYFGRQDNSLFSSARPH